jgi:hypothetical protein
MHTIELQLDDNLYEKITQRGIDIKEQFQEFLLDFVDDGYPAISTQEAIKRVSKVVESHKNDTATYLNEKEYQVYKDRYIKGLKSKSSIV